jgi:predicted RND superfamily exporter protein
MVATHWAIFSLGLLLTIGSASGLVASLVVLPMVLRLITPATARPAAIEPAGIDSRHAS